MMGLSVKFVVMNGQLVLNIYYQALNVQHVEKNRMGLKEKRQMNIVYRELKLGDNIGIEGSLKTNGYIKLEKYIKIL